VDWLACWGHVGVKGNLEVFWAVRRGCMHSGAFFKRSSEGSGDLLSNALLCLHPLRPMMIFATELQGSSISSSILQSIPSA